MSDSNYTPHIGPLVPHPSIEMRVTTAALERAREYDKARDAEIAALREEVGRLRAALEEIAKDAPEERPERGDWNGNADDDYHVGIEIGRWRAGKIARAALRAQGVRVLDGKESSDG